MGRQMLPSHSRAAHWLVRRRPGRLLVVSLAALLPLLASHAHLAVPGRAEEIALGPSGAVAVSSTADRVWINGPYAYLEFDLRRPSIDVLWAATNGDRQYGGLLGTIHEEATIGGRRVRSQEDRDGARVSWQPGPQEMRVRIDGVDLGDQASSNWVISVPQDTALLRIDRTTFVRNVGRVESLGLAVTQAAVPPNTDPASLVYLAGSSAYRAEVGPAMLEQPGGLLGLLAIDNPELSFTARTDQPERVLARSEAGFTTLSFARRPTRGYVTESVTFRLGWDNDAMTASSDVSPGLEARLLGAGYYGNAVHSPLLGPVTTASMRDYRGSVWSRDSDYAMQGYGYVLHDMAVFKNTLERFLERTDRYGIAPEYILLDGNYGNRQSWDSMANVVQMTHTYVSKTGDLDLYRKHEPAVKRAVAWMRALDTDEDGLPDRDIYPFGYNDTVENGPLHTYAIAKHYAAFLALAELEEAVGRDARTWRRYAQTMKASFARPVAEGGYWNPETGYPIAWKRASGAVYTAFETFGVFEAIRVGLLTDREQLRSIGAFMDANRHAFLNHADYPERLIVGGYEPETRKPEVPLEKMWLLDANAPWVVGISVPARVKLDRLDEAQEMLGLYAQTAWRRTPHAEFGAGPLGRYGAGETTDGGRLWDNWAWFSVVYGTHFGLTMKPQVLEIAPAPLGPALGRRLWNVTYQGARLQMELFDGGYQVQLEGARPVVFKPPYGYRLVQVEGGGPPQPRVSLETVPGKTYVIRAHR